MATFLTLDDVREALRHLPEPNPDAIAAASARQARLTKPPGALGRLEALAIWMAGWQERPVPRLDAPQVIVFAANHGVAARGVSAYPPAVTAQMVANFRAGGAAINQIAAVAGAQLDIHGLELDRPTADITVAPAMSPAEAVAAINAGWDAVDAGTDLLVLGEMGIGNTTSAAALVAALCGGNGAAWAGRGTGIDADGLARKHRAVDAALARHPGGDAFETLASLGGREIAAMTGALLAARRARLPVLLDGFIAGAAAAVLHAARPDALVHVQAAHASAEAGHARLLAHLGLEPLLSLGLRLGEGTGGALAISILRAALACHAGMATFAEAGVSDR